MSVCPCVRVSASSASASAGVYLATNGYFTSALFLRADMDTPVFTQCGEVHLISRVIICPIIIYFAFFSGKCTSAQMHKCTGPLVCFMCERASDAGGANVCSNLQLATCYLLLAVVDWIQSIITCSTCTV